MEEHDNRIGLGSKRIFGYISNKEGRSPAIELELEVKQLASFLIRTKKAHKVALRNDLNGLELSADYNGFIQHCSDQNFLAELKTVMFLMENGELQIEDILIHSWAVPKTTLEYVNGDMGMRTWINDVFKVNL